jgi:hypothetical protein
MLEKNNSTNNLCCKCVKECKQPYNVVLVVCPKFKKKPQQLEFKFKYKKV